MDLKAMQQVRSHCYLLCIETAHGDRDLSFWRNKLNCLAIMTIVVLRKKGEACTAKSRGVAASCCGLMCSRRDWCTSQNRATFQNCDKMTQKQSPDIGEALKKS